MTKNNYQWLTLKNKNGMIVELCSLGASIYRIVLPNGIEATVSPIDKNQFLYSPFYYGKTIGRTSGRLFSPSYSIDDTTYPVQPYRGLDSQLHGGIQGFSVQDFEVIKHTNMEVIFSYTSMSGEGDFPGTLITKVSYQLTAQNALKITYDASTDAPTICNLTNHVYFNLSSRKKGLEVHSIRMDSDRYIKTEANHSFIGITSVSGTPYDFRSPTILGNRLKELKSYPFSGIDHCFLWTHQATSGQIRLRADDTPYELIVSTSYPSAVVYTLNDLEPTKLRSLGTNSHHGAIAIECSFPPGGIQHHELPTSILRPGETYHHTIEYLFREIR